MLSSLESRALGGSSYHESSHLTECYKTEHFGYPRSSLLRVFDKLPKALTITERVESPLNVW